MIHSIGCPQPSAPVIFNQWDKTGVTKCVHAFIEPDGDVFQNLPWNHRGWHGGKAASNNAYIGVEMTEPATIKYIRGAVFNDLEPFNTKKHVLATYQVAVELFAYLCKEYKLDPLAKGIVISHSEGNKMGIASAHADVEHLWSKFGLTMDKFRQDIHKLTKPVMPELLYGSKGESVVFLQVALQRKGYTLKADGHFGPVTLGIVKEFQRKCNISATGLVRQDTWDKLM